MKYILLISITTLFFSCKSTKKIPTEEQITKPTKLKKTKLPEAAMKESLFLSMERTPCFGKCPTYKLMIFNTGNVIFEGYSNTKYIGKYKNQLSKKQLREIKTMMDEINIMEMKDVYDSKATDLPSTVIFIVNENSKKKILDRMDAPAELKQFEKLIDFLVINDQLTQQPTNK
ncbi:MAG: DUF6438 domain-containing protein [Vicingaceae bacterium]